MSLELNLKELRVQAGLTQKELSYQADISLATLQNLEAGKGNPELSTLNKILKCLSLEIKFVKQDSFFEELISFGLPIMQQKGIFTHQPTKKHFIFKLSQLSLYIEDLKSDTKMQKATIALLAATKLHYPSIWQKLPKNTQNYLINNLDKVSIKHTKLSLNFLGQYL